MMIIEENMRHIKSVFDEISHPENGKNDAIQGAEVVDNVQSDELVVPVEAESEKIVSPIAACCVLDELSKPALTATTICQLTEDDSKLTHHVFPIIGKMVEQSGTCKVLTEMTEPILERDSMVIKVTKAAHNNLLDVTSFADQHFHSHWKSKDLLVNTIEYWTESDGSKDVDGSEVTYSFHISYKLDIEMVLMFTDMVTFSFDPGGWSLSQSDCASVGFSGEHDDFYSVANVVDIVATTGYILEYEGFIRHGKTSFAPISSLDTVVGIGMRQTYDIMHDCFSQTDDGVNDCFVNHLCVIQKLNESSTSSGSKGVFVRNPVEKTTLILIVPEELNNGNLYHYSKKASTWILTTYCLDNVLRVDRFLTVMIDSGRWRNSSLQLIGSVHTVEAVIAFNGLVKSLWQTLKLSFGACFVMLQGISLNCSALGCEHTKYGSGNLSSKHGSVKVLHQDKVVGGSGSEMVHYQFVEEGKVTDLCLEVKGEEITVSKGWSFIYAPGGNPSSKSRKGAVIDEQNCDFWFYDLAEIRIVQLTLANVLVDIVR